MNGKAKKWAAPLAGLALLTLLVFLHYARATTATAMGDVPEIRVSMDPPVPLAQVDTPPAVAQAGWPFRELPMVLKIEGPRPRIAIVPTPPMRVVGPLAPPQRVFPPAPPVTSTPVPAGLLAPVALGAALGGTAAAWDGGGSPEPPTGQVVPEPATVVLMLTGLVLLAGVSARRTG